MPTTKRKKPFDADSPEFTAEMFKRAKRFSDLPPERQAMLTRHMGRGPQKSPTKVVVTMRLSPDVVAELRATGRGWQTRVDEILRKAVLKSSVRSKAA